MYALIDCNNFFVSCERVFRPDLEKKPTAVLSNNDGCFVARSQEVKDLEIPMGAPLFKYRDMVANHSITLFSSNFELYGDMSNRVMQVLEEFAKDIEIYSIDEAFIKVPEYLLGRPEKITEWAYSALGKVGKYTGLPVSIGIAETKTLCKLANEWGKIEKRHNDVTNFTEISKEELDIILQKIPIEDIWGIGRNRQKLLKSHGIYSSYDLKNADRRWIRSKLSVQGERTQLELWGTSCFNLDSNPTPKKGIASTRSFGRYITDKKELREAVSDYTANAARKLRKQKSVCSHVTVFIRTNPHALNLRQKSVAAHINLPYPSDLTSELIENALAGLDEVFESGYKYAKAGIYLSDISQKKSIQENFFFSKTEDQHKKEKKLMEGFDVLNSKYGKQTLYYGSQGIKKKWKNRKGLMSSRFTTKWGEVLTV